MSSDNIGWITPVDLMINVANETQFSSREFTAVEIDLDDKNWPELILDVMDGGDGSEGDSKWYGSVHNCCILSYPDRRPVRVYFRADLERVVAQRKARKGGDEDV